MKKNHSVEFQALWQDNRYNRAPLLSTILLRMVIAVAFGFVYYREYFQGIYCIDGWYCYYFGLYDDAFALVEETVHFYGTYFYTEFTLP